MSVLHRFDLEANKEQLEEYLLASLPSTNSLIGWYVGLGFFDSDRHGKCVIWTSHPDPFQCIDPVVWIFDSDHRLRFHVSTEAILDRAEFTPEAFELAYSGVYNKEKGLPKYFIDPELEKLYNKSKEIVRSTMLTFKKNHKTNSTGENFVLLHGTNCLWNPVFHENFDVIFDAPCFKFIKALSSFDQEKELNLPSSLKMDVLYKSDVAQVKQSNKVDYPLEYVEDCFRINSAIRTIDTNELAAWCITHRDMFVGSLHVMPNHRRKGLAEIVLQDICKKYSAYFKKKLPNNTREVYSTATVETFNNPSASLFRKTGWTEFGIGVSWIGYK